MKKILIAPDSFKGTMSSLEVCSIIAKSFSKMFKNPIITLPIADGGEGSIEAFLHVKKGKKIYLKTTSPDFKTIDSYYAILEDNTAIVEVATTAGLGLVKDKNPALTTTCGVGEQIKDAIENGCKKVIVCLGGSATNDAGCGLVSALGAKFYDKNGKKFIPVGSTLKKIAHIELNELNNRVDGVSFTTICDITNPLYGKNGAAYVFAPQKGANEAMVKLLDENLKFLNEKVKKLFNIDMQTISGSGAAGGMGGGAVAFLNSNLKLGIDVILENASFDELIKDCALVVSGEGKLDSQSVDGKVICGIAKRCNRANVPLVCIVGGYEGEVDKFYELGVNALFPTTTMPRGLNEQNVKKNLADVSLNVARMLKLKV